MLVFSTITNLFAINNLSTEVQNMVKGGIIVAAVLVQQFRGKSSCSDSFPARRAARSRHRRRSLTRPLVDHPFTKERFMIRSPIRRPRRRRFLAVGAVVGAGALLAACTSNEPDTPAAENNGQAAATAGDNAAPGKKVTIGFSGPRPTTAGSRRSPTTPRRRPRRTRT